MQLLDKNAATRLSWKGMCEHPFWHAPLPQRNMPPEPMLEAFIERHGLRPAAPPPPDAKGLATHVRAAQVQAISIAQFACLTAAVLPPRYVNMWFMQEHDLQN